MCGATDPRAAIGVLKEAFSPRRVVVKEHLRGKEMNNRWNAGSKRRSTEASVSI
jgi:S-adenosylmethionine/arginine decarboxylase-like enzyme